MLVNGVDISSLEGWMIKINSNPSFFGKNMNRRWFKVGFVSGAGADKKLVISYATSKLTKEPRGWLYVEDISGVYCRRDMIEIVSPSRTLRLKGETAVEHRLWSDSLYKLCNPTKAGSTSAASPSPVKRDVGGRQEAKQELDSDEEGDRKTQRRQSDRTRSRGREHRRTDGESARGRRESRPTRQRYSDEEDSDDDEDRHRSRSRGRIARAEYDKNDREPRSRRRLSHNDRRDPDSEDEYEDDTRERRHRSPNDRDWRHERHHHREQAREASRHRSPSQERERLQEVSRHRSLERQEQRAVEGVRDEGDDDSDDERANSSRASSANSSTRSLLVAQIKAGSFTASMDANGEHKSTISDSESEGEDDAEDPEEESPREPQESPTRSPREESTHEELSPSPTVSCASPVAIAASPVKRRDSGYFDSDEDDEREAASAGGLGSEDLSMTSNNVRPSLHQKAPPVGGVASDNNFVDEDWDEEEPTAPDTKTPHAAIGGGVTADTNFATEDWDD